MSAKDLQNFDLDPGLTHSFLHARHSSSKAADAFDRICASIKILAEAQ